MKRPAAEQDAIVQLLTRIYGDIRDVEVEYGLLAGGGDFRPRIEHFHDAVRAFTSKNAKEREAGGRLSVEWLAYDVSCLRYLCAMPLSPFKPHGEALSPHTGVVAVKPGLAVKPKRADRNVRERLGELYRNYAMLFAALLKPFADRDYHDRVDDLNQEVEAIHALIQQIEAGAQKGIDDAIAHIGEDALRHELVKLMHKGGFRKKSAMKKLAEFLKAHAGRKDKEIAGVEAAHMNYALAQLAVFEESKDTLKKMAQEGMNLVGKFVESAMAESKHDLGR